MAHHIIRLSYGDTYTIIAPAAPHISQPYRPVLDTEINEYPIFSTIVDKLGVSLQDIIGRSRKHHLVLSRILIGTHLVRSHRLSLARVGKLLCRDHSTIIHYLHQHDNMIRTQYTPYLSLLKTLQYDKD